MISEADKIAFIEDALPLIYRTELSGKIVFLAGGFHDLLVRLKTTPASFHTINELLAFLSIDRTIIEKILATLGREKSEKISARVTIKVEGDSRRHLWIATLSKDKKHIQGQFIDIENYARLQDRFDRLRQLTYGTQFLGERIAAGQESTRIRNLSIMFIDAVDSTRRIFSLEVEKAKAYVEDLAGIITSVTKQYNGYLDKFMGDGAMIVWGYKVQAQVSREDHVTNAILAAKEFLGRCKEYNRSKLEIEQIHIRIGIASGDVFSGVLENNDRLILTSIGQAVNIAARLQAAADVDGILVEHSYLLQCQRINPDVFTESQCTFFKLKGIPEDIRACKIV